MPPRFDGEIALAHPAAGLRSVSVSEEGAELLSSLNDVPAGKRWLQGKVRIGSGSSAEEIRTLQRALMKIGTFHWRGRAEPALLLMPTGADGILGSSTVRALGAALRLAGGDLTPAAQRFPLGRDVAEAIEALLSETPGARSAAPMLAARTSTTWTTPNATATTMATATVTPAPRAARPTMPIGSFHLPDGR